VTALVGRAWRVAALIGFAALVAGRADAQQTNGAQTPVAPQIPAAEQAPGTPQPQGPLVLQPIQNAVVFTPDFKFTDIAGTTGELLGAYAGVDFDRKFLVGAAGYWLVDPTNVVSMGYGGVLFGWRLLGGHGPVRLDVRDLVGGGSATAYAVYNGGYVAGPPPQVDPRHPYYPYYPGYGYPGRWTGFFVTEPEARVQLAFSSAVAIDAGVSYRVVAGSGIDNLLHGVAGSIGVRFSIQ
jgi:hypothetical protein